MRSKTTVAVRDFNSKLVSKISRLPSATYGVAAFAVVFGVVGLWLLAGSHAATPTASVQAESGSISSAASSVSDTSASGSRAIKFGAGTTTGGGGGGGGTGGGTQTLHCMPTPSVCGFPDTTNSGVPPGTNLTVGSGMTVRTAGTVIQNMKINGVIDIYANNVTIKNSEIYGSGSFLIYVRPGVTGVVVDHTTMHGIDTSANVIEYGIVNQNDPDLKATNDQFYNCHECFMGEGTLTDSYLAVTPGDVSGAHYEALITWSQGMTANHDTFLNPHSQTAAFYGNSPANLSINNSLLAGGGYAVYGSATGTIAGINSVTNSHFSKYYYPKYGYYGIAAYWPTNGVWTGNVDDDTGATVGS